MSRCFLSCLLGFKVVHRAERSESVSAAWFFRGWNDVDRMSSCSGKETVMFGSIQVLALAAVSRISFTGLNLATSSFE